MAAPLTASTSSKTPFQWNLAADEAFKILKSKFTSAPNLQVPDPDRQFVVEVDALDVGVRAVPSQRSSADQKLNPCTFCSLRLSLAEGNYDNSNSELLDIKLALEVWWHWLEGTEELFLIWTDHKNLEYVHSVKILNSRQVRYPNHLNLAILI